MGWWRNQYEDTPAAKQKRQYNPAFLSWFLAETLGTVTCCCFAPANPNQRGDSTARDPKAPLNSNLSHWVVSLIALLWMPLLLSDCKSPCHLGYHVKHFWWWCRAFALKYYSREEAQASKITPVTDSAHRDKERGDRMGGSPWDAGTAEDETLGASPGHDPCEETSGKGGRAQCLPYSAGGV